MALAHFISRVFEPSVVLLLFTIGAVWTSTLTLSGKVIFLIALLLCMFVPVMLLRVWAVKKGILGDWDVSKREQRPKALLVLLLLGFVNLIIVKIFGDGMLFRIFLVFYGWLLGFSLITLWWKISGHVGITTLAAGLMFHSLGIHYWPVLISVPLVGWSRVTTGNHTPSQVLGGAAYSFVIIWLYSLV